MGVKVLVVDDAVFMRKMIGDILKKEGYEVVGEAENGKEAVDKYMELKPDLVTMDIVMPKVGDIDGIGAVKQIMEQDTKAKILMVSAMGQHALVVEAIQAVPAVTRYRSRKTGPRKLTGAHHSRTLGTEQEWL